MRKLIKYIVFLSIVVISLAMHYKHFPKELISYHVWRQTFTQSTINNFYEEDFNILHPHINNRGSGDGTFRMEFPLMQWLIACFYKIFGNHLIISRIFVFITGLFAVFGMYKLQLNIFNRESLSLMGAWAFNFSPSFYYYTINPQPDTFALCCAIWGLAFFFMWHKKPTHLLLIISGVFLSLGTLSKLPFIIYYLVPFVFFLQSLLKNDLQKPTLKNIFIMFTPMVFPAAWYISAIPTWQGNGIVQGMLDNAATASQLFNYLQYNLISTLPELLLNYGSVLFFLAAFDFIIKNRIYKSPMFPAFAVWGIGLLCYVAFEINMIARVHDYYLFPLLPPLFILVGYGAHKLFSMKAVFFKYLVFFMLLILPFTAYLRMQGRWSYDAPGFNKDLLLFKEELRNATPHGDLCIAGNDNSNSIFFYYIDKKGWTFDNDNVDAAALKEMIEKGARYLYSDSRAVDENKDLSQYLDKLILERGSIRVYSLKQK